MSGAAAPTILRRGLQAQHSAYGFEALDDVGYVLFEADAQFLGAPDQLVAGNLAGEALVLHLLDDGVCVHLVEASVRTDVRDREDEAAQLVAGVYGPRQQADSRHAGVIAMAEDRLDDLVRILEAPQFIGPAHWMRLGVALVVEVV